MTQSHFETFWGLLTPVQKAWYFGPLDNPEHKYHNNLLQYVTDVLQEIGEDTIALPDTEVDEYVFAQPIEVQLAYLACDYWFNDEDIFERIQDQYDYIYNDLDISDIPT